MTSPPPHQPSPPGWPAPPPSSWPPPAPPAGWSAAPGYQGQPPPTHPPYGPAPYGRAPSSRRRSGTLARVLSVLLILVVCVAGAGYLVLRPKWDNYRLMQDYQELSFSVAGFQSLSGPQINESPRSVSEAFQSNADRVREEDFLDRALDSLYEWARNHGSTAPREDFSECFASSCIIGWVYGDRFEITILMNTDFSIELSPLWSLSIIAEPV